MGYFIRNRLKRELVEFGGYLCDYETISEFGEGDILDRDDLMHLLIFLVRYPTLVKDGRKLEQRLTEFAVSYAIELAGEPNEDFVYYLMVIPEGRIVEEASSVIATNKLY